MKSLASSSALIGLLATLGAASAPASAVVIESFDGGSWGAGWSNNAAGAVNAGAAHDGAFGVTLDGGVWTYNTDFQFGEGSKLSAWVKPTAGSNGRVYLGFGADANGAQSFVGATNTGDIRFQDNPGYGFIELNTSSFQWTVDSWYLMEVDWLSGGLAIGNLYAADGSTLLASVTQDNLPRTCGGVALRGFNGWDLDTVSVNPLGCGGTPVPEPGSLALIALGLVGVGFRFGQRRKG